MDRRTLLALALSAPLSIQAQSLPDVMELSPDGHLLTTNGRGTGGFFREDTVRTMYLDFAQPNFWTLLQQNYQSQTPIPATLVFDGQTYDSVGVRFKGQTSYLMLPPGAEKMSFDINVDEYVAGQDLKGYESFNLNNAFQDASFMREATYLHLIRRHIPAAKANYVKLVINGQNWGPYVNVQELDGEYIAEWWFSNDGTRWRADTPDGTPGGGGPGGGGGPNWGDGTAALNYLGADTSLYQPYYTLKKANKANPWDDLVNVCDKLNNTPLAQLQDTIDKYMDLDRTLWFLATEIAFGDDDSYVYKGKMDYGLYWEPETGRMVPQEYDGNSILGTQSLSWSPFYHETDVNYPLLNRLLAVPEIRQRYLAHLRSVITDGMDATLIGQKLDDWTMLIDTMVQNDPKKLMSYTQFINGINTLETRFNTRRNNLLANGEVAQPAPLIGTVEHDADGVINGEPQPGNGVHVTASVSSGNGLQAVTLFLSAGLYGRFERLTMFDDGLHDDGAAGDGLYAADIPGQDAGTWVRYYVEAAAGNPAGTVSYSPPGAEHDVYVYRTQLPSNPAPSVVINELMARNSATAYDEYFEYEDWIEIHNPTGSSVDLGGWFLSDSPFDLFKWTFPSGTLLPPDGYLIVWADEDGWQAPLHANFKLDGDGEQVYLLSADSLMVDEVVFDAQPADMGLARVPNGFGPFVVQSPTFAGNNDNANAIDDVDQGNHLLVYPNPAVDMVTFTTKDPAGRPMTVLDATGRQVASFTLQGRTDLYVGDWAAGTYIVRSPYGATRLVVFDGR